MDPEPPPSPSLAPDSVDREARVDAAPGAPQVRAAARATVEYFLRQVETIGAIVDGDLILGIVVAAMGSANVRSAARSPEYSPHQAGADEAIPDALKTPISVAALAASLGLPYETARRYVGRLQEMGMCVRKDAGWIVPAEVLAGEAAQAVLLRGVVNTRRFILALRAAGIDVDAIR